MHSEPRSADLPAHATVRNMSKSAYLFFSIHERLFDAVAKQLQDRYSLGPVSGFIWGHDQLDYLERSATCYGELTVFSRDVLPAVDPARVDSAYLERCEREYGVSIHRMVFAERNIRVSADYDWTLSLVERLFRTTEAAFDRCRPDFLFSENVSGLSSYVVWAVAKQRNIPFWAFGASRMENRLAISRSTLQEWSLTDERFEQLLREGLPDDLRRRAEDFVSEFRNRPRRLSHVPKRARLPTIDREQIDIFTESTRRYFRDRGNPTLTPPGQMVFQRARRLVRANLAKRHFEPPVEGERYVLFPIHYQPEASTLVQAPLYLDQAALIEDIAKSLPVGYRLYVKEHFTNRGRRELDFYRRIKDTPGTRLLGPDEDSWTLMRNAAAIAVITGSMGWEGLLFAKPVVAFGQVYYNTCPLVHRAWQVPKDSWGEVFRRAIHDYRHDEDVLLAFVGAILDTTLPGFLKNATVFPKALSDENVTALADAVAGLAGLNPSHDANQRGDDGPQ